MRNLRGLDERDPVLWRLFARWSTQREQGRIVLDAREYLRAHPQASSLTVNGYAIALAARASHLAVVTIAVTRPGPFPLHVT